MFRIISTKEEQALGRPASPANVLRTCTGETLNNFEVNIYLFTYAKQCAFNQS